jgi:16S rRNA (cytosine967-C5)-methyltransferase
MVIGTLRWRGAIDYQLQRLSAKPLHRLDDDVLDALRVASYQILYLDRVPVSAVVNDAVQLVKAAGFRSAAGFANAVLRRLARERDALPWPVRPQSADELSDRRALIGHLAVVHSHPAWLVERWLDRYGVTTTEAWLQFNNRAPAITIATNRLRATRDELATRLRAEGVETTPTHTGPYGLTVTAGRVLSSAAFIDGWCVVQDEASQIVTELVEGAAGDSIFDACASPGGKTIALAAQSHPSGMVVAADVRPRRVRLLAETIRRCRAMSVRVVHTSDIDDLPFRTGVFNRVLVDAPCSGLGTVRRDPDIRWKRSADDLPALAEAQRHLLSRVAAHVAPGGRLVYSTCSSEPEENEQVVEAFLARASDFRLMPLSEGARIDDSIRAMATPAGYLRTAPPFGLEAFFGAVLVRSPA